MTSRRFAHLEVVCMRRGTFVPIPEATHVVLAQRSNAEAGQVGESCPHLTQRTGVRPTAVPSMAAAARPCNLAPAADDATWRSRWTRQKVWTQCWAHSPSSLVR